MPLVFSLGEAFQFDWSEDRAVIGGRKTKLQIAQFKHCYSRAFILRAYLLQTHEMLFDSTGRSLGLWDPWAGPMPAQACWYRMRFRRECKYRLHTRATLLQARLIFPEAGLKWLTSEHRVLAAWLATISGDAYDAGLLGSFITEADALSAAAALSGGVIARVPAAHAKPLHQHLVTDLR